MMQSERGQESSETRAVVEMLVFSGRPDPAWQLEGLAVKQLQERLAEFPNLPKAQPPSAPILGYQGFLVTLLSPQEWKRVHAFRGTVAVETEKQLECRSDKVGLESLLMEQAKERGYGPLLSE